jgi:endo-1,4-beta-D-glucanase Y
LNRTRRALLLVGVLLVVVAAGIFATVAYMGSQQRNVPLIYSKSEMLYELWNTYKQNNLEPASDRTIDHSQPGNITTSEGESYTMMRAAWMDDETTFNRSLDWSLAYLQRPDHLFSWKYGELSGGKYGINMTNGNYNSASDADTDIALALLMGYSRWDQPQYLGYAQQIITSIWNEEVVSVAGQPVMTADNLESTAKTNVVVDPSYFNPAAYRIFAKIDPTHNWTGLITNSYTILNQVSTSNLGSSSSAGLPPDWIEINKSTGTLIPNATTTLNTNYGFDAFRVPFYLALDWEWYHDPRDKQVLSNYSYLATLFNKNGALDASYAHDGAVVDKYQAPAMYGGSIGYFIVENPSLAKTVYQNKLLTLYNPDTQAWRSTLSYYDDNWAWFGMALEQNDLPNLTTHT